MNDASRSTIDFCLKFILENVDVASQRTQCRTWLTTAISTIKNEKIGAEDFVLSELKMIDQYLSGASGSMTSVDVLTKLDTVKQLLG